MAFSYTPHTGDGVTKTFPFTFEGIENGYIRESDIHVYIDGIEVFTFTFTGPTQITLTDAPEDQADIQIRREMPEDVPYTNFVRGNNFGQDNMNNSFLQTLYLIQETLDGFKPPGYYEKQDLNLGGNLISDLKDPISDQDAATRIFVADEILKWVAGTGINTNPTELLPGVVVKATDSEIENGDEHSNAFVDPKQLFDNQDNLGVPVDVRRFGAVGGDSAVDEIEALEAAEAYAFANGKSLLIPEGYTFYTTMFTTRVSIEGKGTIRCVDTAPTVLTTVLIDGTPDITVKDITVNGNGFQNGLTFVNGSHRCKVLNATVTNTRGSLIDIRNSDDCKVLSSYLHKTTTPFGDGVLVLDAERTLVAFNTIHDFTRDGIVFETGCKNSTACFNIIFNGHDSTDGYNAGIWTELGTSATIIGNIIDDMESVIAYHGVGIVVATDGTKSNFIIQGNQINKCDTGIILGGDNVLTSHIVSNNTITNYLVGVQCGSGATFNISKNSFGAATFTDSTKEGCIVYNNTLANVVTSLIIEGNTKVGNTYTDGDSADIRFQAASNPIGEVIIANNPGGWRINSADISSAYNLHISNSGLSFNVATPASITFPQANKIFLSNSSLTLGSNMLYGKGLTESKMIGVDIIGSGIITLGTSGINPVFRFSDVSTAPDVQIVEDYGTATKEYWGGLFTIRKKIDCSASSAARTIVVGGTGWKLNIIKSQIRVDDSMAGVTGNYLSLTHGSTVDYGSSGAASGGQFAKNNKGIWINHDGTNAPQLVAGENLFLASTLADTQGSTIVGGGNFGGAAGDEVTAILQGHIVYDLPNI